MKSMDSKDIEPAAPRATGGRIPQAGPCSAPRRAPSLDAKALALRIKAWGAELGFQQVGIADCDMGQAEARMLEWLGKGDRKSVV